MVAPLPATKASYHEIVSPSKAKFHAFSHPPFCLSFVSTRRAPLALQLRRIMRRMTRAPRRLRAKRYHILRAVCAVDNHVSVIFRALCWDCTLHVVECRAVLETMQRGSGRPS